MADVLVADDALRLTLTVPEQVLSLHRSAVVVPLREIRTVRATRDVLAQLRGLRAGGIHVPGVSALGEWRGRDEGEPFCDFVLVERPGNGVVITTSGRYDRLVLGAADPTALVARLRSGPLVTASDGRPPSA